MLKRYYFFWKHFNVHLYFEAVKNSPSQDIKMLHVDLRTSQECVWRKPSRILLTGSHTDGRAADARFRFEANVLRATPYCPLRLVNTGAKIKQENCLKIILIITIVH